MPTEDRNPIASHRLVRVAAAVILVAETYAEHVVIAAFLPRVLPLAQGYLALESAVGQLKQAAAGLVDECSQRLVDLRREAGLWLGPLSHDLPGFDPAGFLGTVPAENLSAARALVELVQARVADVTYANELINRMNTAIERASAAYTASQIALTALQDKQAEKRELAAAFQRAVIPFRRTVRTALGSSHNDYRRLLSPRSRTDEPPVETTTVPATAPTSPAGEAVSAATNGNTRSAA